MTKYVSFSRVDAVTGISVNIATSNHGSVNPPLTGLVTLFQSQVGNVHYIGTCDDSNVANPSNGITILDAAAYDLEITNELARRKTEAINQIYAIAKNLIDKETVLYHAAEMAAGINKVQLAESVLAVSAQPGSTQAQIDAAGGVVTQEAMTRKVTTQALAQIIMNSFSVFTQMASLVAGTRGLKCDAINSITFDANNPLACLNAFSSTIPAVDSNNNPIMLNGQQVTRLKYDVNLDWPPLSNAPTT